jgi:hypothetical protein
MKMIEQESIIKAESTLRDCLGRVPFLRIIDIQREVRWGRLTPDLVIRVLSEGSEKEKVLMVEVKSSGQPKLAREAIAMLKNMLAIYKDSYGIFAAPFISEESAGLCEQVGIGYVDFVGNCRFSFDRVYIEQSGNPNRLAQKRDLKSLYSTKAERVLRVLLNNPNRSWKILELAEESRVSTGEAYNIKKLLLDREWIKADNPGIRLTKWNRLISEWSEKYTYIKNQIREYYSLANTVNIESDLAEACQNRGIKYALTGFSGAARLAPMVKYNRAMIYIDADPDTIARALGLKEVSSGSNVMIFLPYDSGVFYRAKSIDGIEVVSPVQLYLDLKGFRGRGEEAADEIYAGVIQKEWPQEETTPLIK